MLEYFNYVIFSFVFIIISIILSYREKIGIEKETFIASILSMVQLLILGYILTTIFSMGMVVSYIMLFVMISVATYMVYKKIKVLKNRKWFIVSLFTTFFITSAISFIILILSHTVKYEPQYIIPLMGMVIGNSMNTVHLTLNKLIDLVKSRRDELWGYFALGATELQALRPFMVNAVKSAVIPQMNRTKSVGIIFIPGAMTGMLLSGADPLYAATIQIVIMWMILSGAIISGILICYLIHKDVVKI